MGKVRLHDVAPAGENGGAPTKMLELKPLRLSGLVVRKADLVEAMRIFVPAISDIQVTEDGQQFWLLLDEGGRDEDSSAS